jgi:hypothetical protein
MPGPRSFVSGGLLEIREYLGIMGLQVISRAIGLRIAVTIEATRR